MPNFITRKTHERIIKELTKLREVDLVEVSRVKQECAEQGDLRENFGYAEAKQKLEMIQNRILELNDLLAGVQFIDEIPIPGNMVSIGTTITLLDKKSKQEEIYHILGPADSNIDKGIISFQTPLAKGMMTKKEGDEFTIQIPEGSKEVKILKIEKFKFES